MEWNIQARAHACQSCKTPFADKEAFHTLLFDQKGGYERQDICQKCWTEQFSEGATDRKGFVSHWQTINEVAPPPPPEPLQKETAETLLRKLIEQNDPTNGPALYILAAMLERKRILKVKAQLARDGERVFVYEQSKTGDLFHIVDPNLQLHQLEQVQHQVLHLLQHGLDSDPQPQADPAAVEASTPTPLTTENAGGEQPPDNNTLTNTTIVHGV